MSKDNEKAIKVLQKPVHVAILRPAHVQKLTKEGKLPKTLLSIPTPPPAKLPDGTPPPKPKPIPAYQQVARRGAKARKETMIRTRLRVFHDNVPPTPKDKIPPCDDCKTSACCYAFMVNISPEEYESGLYGEYAVKLTHQDAENLGGGRFTRLATMNMPSVHTVQEGEPQYFLEGPVGQPCPLLQEDGKCGIYDRRPVTCRTYTCVDDARVTQEMRDGEVEDIGDAILRYMVRDVE